MMATALLFADNVPTREASRLWLGTASGELQAVTEQVYNAPTSGEVVFLRKHGEFIEAHEVWGIFNRELLFTKEKSLRLAKRGLKFQLEAINTKRVNEESKLKEKLEALDEEILNLEKLKEASYAEEYLSKIKLAITEKESDKSELVENFEREFSEEKLAYERDQLLFTFEKQQADFRNSERQAYLKAGVGGRLTYLLPEERFDPNNKDTAYVTPSDSLILIRDDSDVLVVTPEKNFERPLKLNGSYFARISSESGMKLQARLYDSFTVLEKSKPVKYYRFKVSKGDLVTARNTVGQSAIINVLQEFEEEHTIIKKEDIIRMNPTLLQESGWEYAALTLFPKMKIVAVGKGSIAMTEKY